MRLRLRERELELEPGNPLLVGIVNAGPDSFSDPGPRRPDDLVEHALRLVEEGATIVDVGGESGRTDRPPVPEAEEAARVVPVIERLAPRGVLVSVDTWRAATARAALDAGAAMVNDASGLRDPDLPGVCAEAGAALVVTHAAVPPKQKGFPLQGDVVEAVRSGLAERLADARDAGVGEERVLLDPGLDLGKTPAQSVELLRRLGELGSLGRPLLVAPSRKDFVGALTGRAPRERLAGTLAAAGAAVEGGAAALRVHDVAEAADYLRVRAALAGDLEVSPDARLAADLRREAEPGRAA